MKINQPKVLREVTEAFERYEAALTSNDIAVLDALFWDSPHALRYGTSENLYGYAEIQAFRAARSAQGIMRTVRRREITSYGDAMATANIEFERAGSSKIGRQSQTWIKFLDGWRIVAAHVSLIDPLTPK